MISTHSPKKIFYISNQLMRNHIRCSKGRVIVVRMSDNDIVKKCEYCNELFTPKKKPVRSCSRDCTNKFVNSFKNKRIEIKCDNTNCDKIFPRKPYLIQTINFCSRVCYDESRSKPVNVRCFSCNKVIKRLPRELHERNFCSTQCQANAPKIRKKCAVCSKDVTRRIM